MFEDTDRICYLPFSGLNLLDIISFIRKDEREAELAIQFEVI